MINFLDYIYYRIYSYYSRSKYDSSPELTGQGLISMVQTTFIMTVWTLTRFIWNYPAHEYFNRYKLLPFGFALLGLNIWRYNKARREALIKKWSGEKKEQKRVRAWLIIFGLLLLSIINFFLGKYFQQKFS